MGSDKSVLVTKPEGWRALGRCVQRRKLNIKVDLCEIRRGPISSA
jgi:hypothetical protein